MEKSNLEDVHSHRRWEGRNENATITTMQPIASGHGRITPRPFWWSSTLTNLNSTVIDAVIICDWVNHVDYFISLSYIPNNTCCGNRNRKHSGALPHAYIPERRWAQWYQQRWMSTRSRALDCSRMYNSTELYMHKNLGKPCTINHPTDWPDNCPTDRQSDRRSDRTVDGPTDRRRTDRQSDRQAERSTDSNRRTERPTDESDR